MRTSLRGANFIARFEGVRLSPYNDPVGFCTVGIGHLIARRRCTDHDFRIWTLQNHAAAVALLRDDLRSRDEALTRLLGKAARRTTITQFNALASLMFNIGEGAFASSTVLRRHKEKPGSFLAGLAFMMWTRAGGRILGGLVTRRRAERKLYRTGRYS